MSAESIQSERLLLRRFVPEDGAALFEYLSDPKVVEFEPYGVLSRAACARVAEEHAKNDAYWAVCLKPDARLIGNLSLNERQYRAWELGYLFHSAYWKQGYASEAARALLGYAVRELPVHRIVARCNPDNTASWRLLERLGLRREGHLRRNIYFRSDSGGNPLWQDTYEYAILAEEWTTHIIS